ncbi:hypothetical protein RS1P1_15230 [Pseudomonas moraviensis]|nr:hypothetical protein RS1P1_15230 [Pseudomonas moraviensis]
MLTTHLTAGNVDPVRHQQIENVAQDADAVLAVDFDAHRKGPDKIGMDTAHVGASLLAKALAHPISMFQPDRFREQARSHRVLWRARDKSFCRGTQIVVKIM